PSHPRHALSNATYRPLHPLIRYRNICAPVVQHIPFSHIGQLQCHLRQLNFALHCLPLNSLTSC
ncbi:MAG: hypothetical protein N2049_05260, partial [Anaerolineales bacterium]|nr:hypothetical protein [Anaerolineales bacterium]